MSNINAPGVSATFTANTGPFVAAIGRAQGALRQMEPVVAQQWWGLQNLGRAFGAVGGLVAAGLKVAVNEAMAWEDAMAGVDRTTYQVGESAESNAAKLKILEDELRAVAGVVPVAASELAGIAESAGALGVDRSDIPEFTKQFAMLSATTNVTADDIDEVARVLNIMDVPVELFDSFVSTLIELGRSTAATETEILNMSKRLAPMARTVGMTTEEVLALSAATLSLGPRSEAGASALTRLFGDISSSIGKGGDDLENWARLVNQSGEEFARAWRTDPSTTIENIVVALSRYEGQADRLAGVLNHLDQTNVRNVITLGALASGVTDVNDKQTSLIAINRVAEEAWAQNIAMTQVAKARFSTVSAQIQIMRNRLSEVANTLGKAVFPAIRFLVGVIENFAVGFQALPSVIQFVVAGIVVLVGIISLLAAGFVALIGPMVLASQTLRTLHATFTGAATAATATQKSTTAAAASISATGAAAQRASGQLSLFTNAQLAATTASTAQATSSSGAAAATAGAGVAAAGAGSKLARFGKVGLIAAGVIAAAAVAITLLGAKLKGAQKDTEKLTEVDMQLVDAIDQQNRGLSKAADELLINRVLMDNLADAAVNAKVALGDIVGIISGRADPTLAKATVEHLKMMEEGGDAEAGRLLDFLAKQRQAYKQAYEGTGQLTTARKDLGLATEDLNDATADNTALTEENAKALDDRNQAIIDYVEAQLSARAAALDYRDAQHEYAKALAEASDPANRIAEAENELEKARLDHEKAVRDVTKAETDLATARERDQDRLADAVDSLADAEDKRLDSLDQIAEIEEKLAEAQSTSLQTQLEMLEATNKLANARLRLRDANQSVRDAEWQLQYLMEEGASARDIENATDAVTDARQEVQNATESVMDAEEGLNDLRDEADRAREIASLERDLAGARRDHDGAVRDIAQRERELADIRAEIAGDVSFREAQAALVAAELGVADAARKVREEELELQRIREGGIQDEVLRAQLDLEQAGYNLATANAEVTKQQALMNGEFWDAGRSAQELARQLGIVATTVPSEEVKAAWQSYIDLLNNAKPGTAPGRAGDAGGGKPGSHPADFSDIGLGKGSNKKAEEEGKSAIGDIFKTILAWVGGSIVGWLIKGLIAKVAGGAAAGAIGGPIGMIVGIIVSLFLDWFLRTELGQKILSSIGEQFKKSWNMVTGAFKWVWDKVWGFIKDLLGIGSPSKVFMQVGGWLIEGLVNGIKDALGFLWSIWSFIPRKIIEGFAGSISWLWQHGGDIIRGLLNGISAVWHVITNVPRDVFNLIVGGFSNSWGWLRDAGSRIIDGLWNGIQWAWGKITSFGQDVWHTLTSPFSNAIDWLKHVGLNLLAGLRNGLIAGFDKWLKPIWNWIIDKLPGDMGEGWKIASPSKVFDEMGRNLIRGLAQGIEGNVRLIDQSMQRVLDATSIPIDSKVMAQFDPSNMRDFAMYQARTGGYAGATNTTTNNNGDHIEINGADNRDALEIADEIMFRKLVRKG